MKNPEGEIHVRSFLKQATLFFSPPVFFFFFFFSRGEEIEIKKQLFVEVMIYFPLFVQQNINYLLFSDWEHSSCFELVSLPKKTKKKKNFFTLVKMG